MSTAPRPSKITRQTPDTIADAVRIAVAQGVYRPGQRLLQDELADRFGVSRIPLREAMRTLLAEGLIMADKAGTFVSALDLDRIDEIYDLRRLVEPSFAAPVVENISRADINRLAVMADKMEQTSVVGKDEWSRTNFSFHLDMYRIANLPMRYEVISRLYHQLEPYSRYYVHATLAMDRVLQEHSAMMDALKSGDSESLALQIIAHIDGGQTGLHKAWATMPSVSTGSRVIPEGVS